jgi:hypothetical protein
MTSTFKEVSLRGEASKNYKTMTVTVTVGEDFSTYFTLVQIINTLKFFDKMLKFRAVAMLVITETKGMISKKNLRARFQHV